VSPRLETALAKGTLWLGVPVFALTAIAVPVLLVLAPFSRWPVALWAVASAAFMLRAIVVCVEALGELSWRRLADVLLIWALVGGGYAVARSV
jgi:hypothetical protein